MSVTDDPGLAILWFDLETTGLDPSRHEILEVGAMLTNRDLEPLWKDTLGYIVSPHRRPVELLHWDNAGPGGIQVTAMHTENGLLDAVNAGGAPLWWVEDDLMSRIEYTCEGQTLMLAGSGVARFDFNWVERHMPRLFERLHYAPLDVGVLRRFIRILFDVTIPGGESSHRAVDDVNSALAQANYFKKFMTPELPPGLVGANVPQTESEEQRDAR